MITNLSSHAEIRAQQRGIRLSTINIIMELADRKVRLPGNVFALSVSQFRGDELVRLGLPAAEIERASNVVAVINCDGKVVTVEHRTRRYAN